MSELKLRPPIPREPGAALKAHRLIAVTFASEPQGKADPSLFARMKTCGQISSG